MKMDLHFTKKEFAERQKLARNALAARDLDGLLMFRQESMYYLSGYASFGYCFFQCLYLGADGKMTLLTRMPDVLIARLVSMLDDIRPWHNLPDANPAIDLRAVLEEHGCRGKRLGIELDAYGLTGLLHSKVQAAMTGFCNLEDASDLVSRLRMIKSPAEIDYCRKAGVLADAALAEANRLSTPGAWEGDILAAMQGAVFKGDGDYSGNEFIINSGERAVVGRYVTGRRRLAKKDQMTIEWAGAYRYYHAAMMRTILTGQPTSKEKDIHKVAVEAHRASAAQIKPGNSFGAVYDAHAKVIKRGGYEPMGATGYNLGATFPPTWMDGPMFWPGNEQEIEVGMVLFIHSVVRTKDGTHAQCPGQTYIVTERGAESLSKMSMDLVANG
ncbi:MAG: Xaa-Pro peptidase family protein [Proteobacteria bacterium]|nr:Xaa-Pro peptidase family protein [Pseudomonadota bacterium]